MIEAAALKGAANGAAWAVLSDWLQEKGDILGERIARHCNVSHRQRELFPPTRDPGTSNAYRIERFLVPDADFRLEVDGDNGVVRRLTARSLNSGDQAKVEAALHLRQLRFLQHLVLDMRGLHAELDFTLTDLERWQLPYWLESRHCAPSARTFDCNR